MNVLHIRQDDPVDDVYPIRLTLRRDGQPNVEAEARIEFTFTDQEHEDLRWYLEDYLQRANATETIIVQQVEALMKSRGQELYTKVLSANQRTQSIWFSIRNELADLRIEIASGVAEAASIPWELMRDPETDSPLSLRVKSFVRVQSDPNTSFVSVPETEEGRIRLLYAACRPRGANDVELRAVANRLLHDLGQDRARFDIKALRPPTFERLQTELVDAKESGRPYHIVHFDGHGIYSDLSKSKLADWAGSLATPGTTQSGKRGYILFEHDSENKMRPVDGQTLGQLLHDNGVPVLVLNACQTAMHEAVAAPADDKGVHDEVRAIGSLAQGVIDQGVPAVLGMRYSVYVVTAAEYIGQLYAALVKGRGFGQAATEGRKHLNLNPDRWIGLQPHPLQDWFVPVAYEAAPLKLISADRAPLLAGVPETDPVQKNRSLLRHVPEEGFIGRDETLFALDRAFDQHHVVLLHAYAGQGKSSTAVEFARWYATTGGLDKQPIVLLASFERHTDLDDLLNQIGQLFGPMLEAQNIHWSAINDREARRDLVVRILRQFPILWIWDNVEPVAGFPEGTESQWTAEQQKDLREFLQQLKLDPASKVKILLTSRRDEKKWLGGIPHRIPMPRMKNSDAARLALRLGDERAIQRSEISNWQPLLRYCAGNPLTLRVLVSQAVEMGLKGEERIAQFVDSIRTGEHQIEDVDQEQGRDKSLGASLNYGFRSAFNEKELPIIALLSLFQTTVDVDVILEMGRIGEGIQSELGGIDKVGLTNLLGRAKDTGLLTHLAATWFSMHPALPWFLRQLFTSHYDGKGGRLQAEEVLRVWVEAIATRGAFYYTEFYKQNRGVISLLEIEEDNLLHAYRTAQQHQWWAPLPYCLQALEALYSVQGRLADHAKLVTKISLENYRTPDGNAIEGLEEQYALMMQSSVSVAQDYERDMVKAAAIQEDLVKLSRQLAADALSQPVDQPLDKRQRNQLRSLAVSLGQLGNIQANANDPDCISSLQQSIAICQRVGDTTEEANGQLNLGNAYLDIPDLDAAEAAYKRSLELRLDTEVMGRANIFHQLGMLYHLRFNRAIRENEPGDTWKTHAQTSEGYYIDALELCPKDSLIELAPTHYELGKLYRDLGHFDGARQHLEQAAQYAEDFGDHFHAGMTRFSIAIMYFQIASTTDKPAQKRINLHRARSYAEAAVRDYQRYEGRAAKDEAAAERLLGRIAQVLDELPPDA